MCRCIDGFSRRIMWLECASTNHDPSLIATYFMTSVRSSGGFPQSVRTDCGTENVTVAAIQSAAVRSSSAHIYGTSPGHQRIEGWWSFLRRSHSQWWIEFFQSFIEAGTFHPGDKRQTDCLRFCFMHSLQHNLNDVRMRWNCHRIRPSSYSRCPAGVPEVLYRFPSSPAVDCLRRISTVLPDEVESQLIPKHTCEDDNFGEYLHYLCVVNNFAVPSTIEEGKNLYLSLLPFI